MLMKTPVRRFRRGQWEYPDEISACEERVSVLHGGRIHALWAWPHDLKSLALGHALLESSQDPEWTPGRKEEIADGCERESRCLPVVLRSGQVEHLPAAAGSHCLRVVLDGTGPRVRRIDSSPRISAAGLLERMRAFFDAPGLWDGTGSFHRAALFCPVRDRLVHIAEDIGRHNCLDRLAGFCAVENLNPASHILFISARITGSLYAKARRAGFELLASRSAVTGAALRFAAEQGVTLVGFCRPNEERLTVFYDAGGLISA
jgi:FdhD protein